MASALPNFKDPDAVSTPDFLTKVAPSLPAKNRETAISTLANAILSLKTSKNEPTAEEREKLSTYLHAEKSLQQIGAAKLQRAPVPSSYTTKVAAVAFGVLLTGAGGVGVRSLRRSPQVPVPTSLSSAAPRPLQHHTWAYVGPFSDEPFALRYLEFSQIANRIVSVPFAPAILGERVICPIPSKYQDLSPVEQLSGAAALMARTDQFTEETPVGILRAACDEASLRGHALEKVAETVVGGREKVDDLEKTARNLATLVCEKYKTASRVPSWNETTIDVEKGAEQPPEWNVETLFDPTQPFEGAVTAEQVEAAYEKKCLYLKRAGTFIDRGEDLLEPGFVRQTRTWITATQKELDSWKAGLMSHIKEQLGKKQAELETRRASLKPGSDICEVEGLFTRVQSFSDEVRESAGHLTKKASISLTSQSKKLTETLYTDIVTIHAPQYRKASLDHLLTQVQGLDAGKPFEEDLSFKRQEDALESLPKNTPKNEYYTKFLSLQEDFDTLMYKISRLRSSFGKQALTQETYQKLADDLDSLLERAIDLSKTKGVTKDEARETKDVLDEVVAKARLVVAKTAVEQLRFGTMSWNTGDLLRGWVLKFLDTLKATGQLGKEGGEAIEALRKQVPNISLWRTLFPRKP